MTARKSLRFIDPPRRVVRGDDHRFRLGAGAAPIAPELITLGMQVWAAGQPGTVTAVAHSLGTDKRLITVAHDPRIRITYRADEIFAAP